MRKLLAGIFLLLASVVLAGSASASVSDEVSFTVYCAKGGGVVSAGHGHDYPYLQCNGGRYNGQRHYIK